MGLSKSRLLGAVAVVVVATFAGAFGATAASAATAPATATTVTATTPITVIPTAGEIPAAQLAKLQAAGEAILNAPLAGQRVTTVASVAKTIKVNGSASQKALAATATSANSAIVLDAKTGKVVGLQAIGMKPANTTVGTSCPSGAGCFRAPSPYVLYGFTGSGAAVSGSWSNRTSYTTGNHSVQVCWTPDHIKTVCGGVDGPNTSVALTGTVTGTSWRNYT